MGERKNGDAVEGYVKLWRKSMESAVFKNANVWKFWCWCLMKATHKPVQILVGYQRVDLVPGQFIFGRAKASKELRLSEREIRTCVDTLSKLENMTIKATNKFSIISICNWDTYQNGKNENDQHNDQQATNKRPTSDHKQEYKECKEEKDKYSCSEPEEEPASEPVFIELPLNDNSVYQIKKSVLDEMQLLYPAVSIENEFRKMRGWLLTNPTRRKTKRGIKKFYNAWLSKEQDRWHKEDKITMSKNDTPSNKQEISPYVCKKCGQGIMYCTCEN